MRNKTLLLVSMLLALAACKENYGGLEAYRKSELDPSRGFGSMELGRTMMGPFMEQNPTESIIVAGTDDGYNYRFSYFGDRLALLFTNSQACESFLRVNNVTLRKVDESIKKGTYLTDYPVCSENKLQSIGVFAVGDPEDNFFLGSMQGLKLNSPYADMAKMLGKPRSMPYHQSASPIATTYAEARYPGMLVYYDDFPKYVTRENSQIKGMVIYRDVQPAGAMQSVP